MSKKFIVNEPYVICILTDRKLGKKFKGIAKCAPEDMFDENKGKQIAELKAKIKRDNYKIKQLDTKFRYLKNWVNNELDQIQKRQDELFRGIKECLRCHHIYNLGSTNEQFEEWWKKNM